MLVGLGLRLLAAPADAQRVTGTIAGKIVRGPEAQAAARVAATNLTTGAVIKVAAGGDGGYVLAELAPGQYLLTVTAANGEETTELVDLGIGQTLQVDLDVAIAQVKGAERIEVSGKRFDTMTSEIATDVSQAQIQNLPQNNRNFLNFAQLAPGVRLSTEELNRNVSSGGLEARQTNVFVDGVSLKNNIIQGGVVGQDASRGNPFPQLAVAGFRVLTQNFKAEYEQAGTALISSVTRSGGNEPHGELYLSYQDRSLTAIDPFAEELMQEKPDYSRYQVGALASGPLVKDRVFGLVTYEGNYQNRANQVAIFAFLGSWNDFLWPLIVLADDARQTLPVALAALAREHAADNELMMAGVVVTIVPVLVVFFALQRHYIHGLLAGSVKG